MNEKLRKFLPHIAAIILFVGLSATYFYPANFEDKVLFQHDLQNMSGWGKDLRDYHEKTGEYAFWSNSMFGGMPANYTWMPGQTNIFNSIGRIFSLNLPLGHTGVLFIYLLGFYILLVSLGCKPLLSIVGAIAYAFASYNLIILAVGHVNKGLVMATMAPVLAGVILCYRRKYLLGGFVTLISVGLNVVWSHQQISYYLLLIILILAVVYFIFAVREKRIKEFFISSAILLAAAVAGIAPSAGTLFSNMDYTKDTMRGGSELRKAETDGKESSGLDIDYAYAWSYGRGETMTLLIPNFNGSSSTYNIGEDSEFYRVMRSMGQPKEAVKTAPMYWGGKQFTSGPNYAGAIICMLFVLGLIIVKGPEKWWLLGGTLLSIFLAWGKNFLILNEFLFYHLPIYNKFRVPEMALTMAGVTMAALAILALKHILDDRENRKQYLKPLYISAGITGGLCLIFALMGSGLMGFTGPNEQLGNYPDLLAAIVSDRKSMLTGDSWRSFAFILLASGALWYYITKNFKSVYLVSILGVLILIDLWSVDRRFLGEDNYVPKKQTEKINPTEADLQILQDKDPNYRVLNLASSTFNESRTAYFHKSIGGYSPAKLQRYQDIIDYYLGNGAVMNKMMNEVATAQGDFGKIDANAYPVINMLNTRYIIFPTQGGSVPLPNPHALGNVWFVNEIKWVDTPNQEIEMLKDFNPAQTAVIDKKWQDKLPDWQALQGSDSTATIRLTDYANPGNLIYESNSSKPSFAVFSEVYYKTWNAYIDGREAPLVRVDYILRGLEIPAGAHQIEFKCVDKIFERGEKMSVASSWAVGILILCVLGFWIWKGGRRL